MRNPIRLNAAVAVLTFMAGPAFGQEFSIQEDDIDIGKKEYSPYLYQSYPNRVFFGDTHLHTSYSTDAGMATCPRA